MRNPKSPHTMVVPLADPPVGTRGRPFLDRFFSGIVGRSQFPGRTAVLENGRREMVASEEVVVLFDDRAMRAMQTGRKGLEAIESLSN
jgi:hypothetical protein